MPGFFEQFTSGEFNGLATTEELMLLGWTVVSVSHRHGAPFPCSEQAACSGHIKGASYRLHNHAELIPEHVRATAAITPPLPPKRQRGHPGK